MTTPNWMRGRELACLKGEEEEAAESQTPQVALGKGDRGEALGGVRI